MKIEWPNNLKEISATVGLIPVFPRYLDNFSFSIGTGVDDSKLLEVCAHETLHFYGLKNEINPKYSLINVGKNNRYGHLHVCHKKSN